MQFPFFLKPKRKPDGPDYADIYPRAIAAGIDFAILYLILNRAFQFITTRVFTGVDQEMLRNVGEGIPLGQFLNLLWTSNLGPLWLLNMAIQVGILGVVLVTTQILWGTTPGKWLMGLKIVRHETLEPLAPWRYVLRFFAYIPAMLPLMLGIFWASFNRQRRGWHDYIAGTVVIHTRSFGWYWGHIKGFYRKLRGNSGAVE